jgi:hypothetical protein
MDRDSLIWEFCIVTGKKRYLSEEGQIEGEGGWEERAEGGIREKDQIWRRIREESEEENYGDGISPVATGAVSRTVAWVKLTYFITSIRQWNNTNANDSIYIFVVSTNYVS